MDKRGQQPVDEHQPVLRAGAQGPFPWPGREPGLVPFVPQRAYLKAQFSDPGGRQTSDSPVADDHCTRRVLHHPTMINDQELDASPPTMHELVSPTARCASASTWTVVVAGPGPASDTVFLYGVP
jgi:hypothetical protein